MARLEIVLWRVLRLDADYGAALRTILAQGNRIEQGNGATRKQ